MKPWMNMKSTKTFAALGAAFGIITASVCTFAAVQMCWFTPGEQNAARAALTAVDDLQNFASANGDDPDSRLRQAEDAVETARQAARTTRDQKVAFALIQYLGSIEAERAATQAQAPAPERIAAPAVEDLAPGETTHLTEAASRSMSLKLHALLD
jgi:type IV secretory pathway VirJ component